LKKLTLILKEFRIARLICKWFVASVRPMTSLAAVGRRNGEARDYDGIRITDPSCNFKK